MTRLALDTLAVLTVCVKSQLALIEPVTLPTGVTEIGIRLGIVLNTEENHILDCTYCSISLDQYMTTIRLLARRASRRPGTPLERKVDVHILGEKGNYFQ